MGLADATNIVVEVTPPSFPFGGALVNLPEANIQIELDSNPAAVHSVFGRTGDITALSSDYDQFFAPLASAVPPGGTTGQVLTKGSSSSFDMMWSMPSGSLANPSVMIGMTPINGTALTGLRSDGAPAIDPSISPSWTGLHQFSQSPHVPTPTSGLGAANKAYVDASSGGVTPADLSVASETNIQLTATGTPTGALLQGVGLHMGWSGTLSLARGGTAQSNQSVPAHTYFGNNSGSAAAAGFDQPSVADLSDGSTGSGAVVLASGATVSNLGGSGTLSTTGAAQKISFSGQTGLMNFSGLTSNNRQKTVRDAADTLLELGGSYTPTGTWDWTSITGTWPTFNQNTTGAAAKISFTGQTGLMNFTGLTSTNRQKTVRDAADTILELGGSYTPTGNWTNLQLITPTLGTPASGNLANCTFPTLNQNTTGSAAKWTTARNLWGASVDGSANVGGAIELGTAGTTDTTLDRSEAGIMSIEGILMPPRWTIRAASTVTQANDTNPHAVFTTPTNGRFTFPSTGTYHFEGVLQWSAMSATSGNLKLDMLGAGTATITNWNWNAWGNDNASSPSAVGGSNNTTSASPASIVAAGTGTTLGITIRGTFEVTGTGTLIPTQTLVTAAPAVLGIGSFISIWKAGATGMTFTGPWD